MDVRRHFPHTEDLIYLDHAATGPLSRPARDALLRFVEQKHVTEPNNYESVGPVLERCRERLAQLIGVTADRVDLIGNTSLAINVLAQGLDWQAGDRVAVPACEFPANVMPWLGLADKGVAVDFVPDTKGTFSVEDVERVLTPRTRVLAVSQVQFLSGFRCDLAALGALCRDRGIILSVDAIQGLGALKLDLGDTPVDFLACGAQKWLMGLPGTAFFYVSEQLQYRLTPVRGWLNAPPDFDDLLSYDMEFAPDATRFRQGTLDLGGIVALEAALALYEEEVGREEGERRVLDLSLRAADGLQVLGLERFGSNDPGHASGIVTVRHPRPDALLAALHQHRIRASVRNGMLRVAPTWYNTDDEVLQTLDVVKTAL